MAEAMYRQIAEDLRARIKAGELAAGSQLPTETELTARYGASRNTIRDAIKLLITLGLVETRPSQGTFVVERVIPFVTTLSGNPATGETQVFIAEAWASERQPTSSGVRVEVQLADAVIANSLRIDEGSQIVSRHQQHFIDGRPWSLQTSFYPMSLIAQGATQLIHATDIEGGAIAYLASQLRIKQAGYRDSISARLPDENEATFFRLPPDGRVPVFEIFRVGFDQKAQRFRLTVTVYPADRNRFLVNIGDVPPGDPTLTTDS